MILLLFACGSDDENWWDLPDDGVLEPEEEEFDEEFDEDEFESGEFGEIEVFDGAGDEGYGSFYLGTEDFALCDMDYELVVVRVLDDCDACDEGMAFRLERGGAEIYANEEEACEAMGATDLEGSRFDVGKAGEELLMKFDGAWEHAGYSELEGNLFWFERYVEVED